MDIDKLNKVYKYIFATFHHTGDGTGSWESVLMGDMNLFIFYIQYHGCCWYGDASGQAINNHGIDPFLLEYFLSQWNHTK